MSWWDQTPGLEAHLRQPQGRVIVRGVGIQEGISRHAAYQRRLQAIARLKGLTLRQYKALAKEATK